MTIKMSCCAALAGLALVFVTHMPLWAQADSDEGRLQAAQSDIDKEITAKGSANHVQSLSKQFAVPADQIEGMRTQKQGWGEITIQLSMAQHLTQTDPKTYPTMNDALAKIQTMRNDRMGWGKIAKDLGFKLGPVVRDAQQVRHDMAREARAERADRVAKQDRPERPDRPVRPERPERPERPGRK